MANGLDPDAMTVEDANEAAEFLVYAGRTIHPSKWVDFMIWEAEEAKLESISF
ncbi:hypothetical protein [Singulisphaera sp. PoT]|uniref:hypothetical protein n=1 Tax=Singulisphaera sp. PoT TaxID=3411797 RepID=UPI003BF55A24